MKKFIALPLSLVFAISLMACGGGSSSSSSSKYKTEIEWALQDPYSFAVEIDGYDGDVVEAGTWTASVSNKNLGEAPMYDIYIESEEFNSISDLSEIDYTVGGVNSADIEISLEKGSYVYVVPVSLAYEPKGHLKLNLNS